MLCADDDDGNDDDDGGGRSNSHFASRRHNSDVTRARRWRVSRANIGTATRVIQLCISVVMAVERNQRVIVGIIARSRVLSAF